MPRCSVSGFHFPGERVHFFAVRIAIVTQGRIQLLELARELQTLGHDVHVYSTISPKRIKAKGISSDKHHRILRPGYLWSLLETRGPASWRRFVDPMIQKRADRAAARSLAQCDLLIGTAGLCVRTLAKARKRYGARILLECSVHHVLAHKAALEEIPNSPRPAVSHFDLKRELWCYQFADVLVTPTRNAANSYTERGIDREKVFWNLPGAELGMFYPTRRPHLESPTILYVGRWSVRKGCNVLAHAVEGQNWRLIHVGPRGDATIPKLKRFEQRDSRPKEEMQEVYRAAHIIVYPSFDDCVAAPQIRGVATGLPLVCTNRSGGDDLREFLVSPDWITNVPAGDVVALQEGIKKGLAMAETQKTVRVLLGENRDDLSWRAYGERYNAELQRRFPGLFLPRD